MASKERAVAYEKTPAFSFPQSGIEDVLSLSNMHIQRVCDAQRAGQKPCCSSCTPAEIAREAWIGMSFCQTSKVAMKRKKRVRFLVTGCTKI